jgi:hypothetical protein
MVSTCALLESSSRRRATCRRTNASYVARGVVAKRNSRVSCVVFSWGVIFRTPRTLFGRSNLFSKNVFIKTVSSSSLQNMHRARAPSRRRVLCENISHSPKRDVDDEERVPIASHRAYTYKTNIVIHNSLIASRNRTVVASRNRTVGRARARIFTRLLKALFGGNYHAEHLSGGGADPDLMSATHCGEKI